MKNDTALDILNTARENGGATWTKYNGFITVGPYYSISLFPEKGLWFPDEQTTWRDVKNYASLVSSLIDKHKMALGLWLDKSGMLNDNMHLDVVTIFEQRDISTYAMRQLADVFCQKSFYDHRTQKVVWV